MISALPTEVGYLFFSQVIYCVISECFGAAECNLHNNSLTVFKCQLCLCGLAALVIFDISLQLFVYVLGKAEFLWEFLVSLSDFFLFSCESYH